MIAHEEFRQLCALASSGCLNSQEQSRLRAHLLSCAECREVAHEFGNVARIGVPSVASDFPAESPNIPFDWSEERAYQEFLERLENEAPHGESTCKVRRLQSPTFNLNRSRKARWPPRTTVQLLPYAVGIVVALLTAFLGYEIGTRRAGYLAVGTERHYESIATAARAQLAQLMTERDMLRAKTQENDKELDALHAEMAGKLSDIKDLRAEEQGLRDSLKTNESDKSKVASERDVLLRRIGQMQLALEHSQADLAIKQKDLDALAHERSEGTQRELQLDARVAQLQELLKDRDNAAERQQELLAYDRDIRDLMGARDLYVAEVFDVGRNGKTKKPFGRIFFTKGKSLIFYAYDLDQQPSLRTASSFQAWGRRGPDTSKAASLGIFYLDNSSHKRWVLKSNDPDLIRQIDAVFVTVEPKGGSQKPTGKQLLFAYLRVEPNHP